MRSVALALLCLALSTAGRANTVIQLKLDGNFPADYTQYAWTATTGQAENEYVDPYITYLTGGIYNNTLVYSFCFDFNAPTGAGVTYTGQFETFTDPADLEATFLMNEVNRDGLLNAPIAERGAISTAIWQIMNPSSNESLNPFPNDPAAQTYITQAVTAVTNGWWTSADAAEFPIWIPDNTAIQRFGIIVPGQPAVPLPEPGSVTLIGAGIAALAMWRRRSGRAAR